MRIRPVWIAVPACAAAGVVTYSVVAAQEPGGSAGFYPTKVTTSAEGGMILTADPQMRDEARIYRDQGKGAFTANHHVRDGASWRLSELNAAAGAVHVQHLAEFVRHRRTVAARYTAALSGIDALTPLTEPAGCVSNFYKYILLLPALFAAGMSLVDTTDGVLMLGAYGWAFVRPIRKLYYNLTITLTSVLIAFVIGGIEALSIVADRFGLHGGLWDLVANLDFGFDGPIDVAACAEGDSAFGCRQMIGNVWEWTASDFLPFAGFAADPYTDYSQPWFGTRKVLRGGCWATSARIARPSYRNFFTPDRNDVFAGFRTCAL